MCKVVFRVKLWTGVVSSLSSPHYDPLRSTANRKIRLLWRLLYLHSCLQFYPSFFLHSSPRLSNVQRWARSSSGEQYVLWWWANADTSESLTVYFGKSAPLCANTRSCTHCIPIAAHQLSSVCVCLCVCVSLWPPLSSYVCQLCGLIKVLFSPSGLISIM